MLFQVQQDNKNFLAKLSGRIDAANSPELRLNAAKIPDDADSLIFDLKDVPYISSSGLRELLICAKRFKSKFKIVNVSQEVFDIFKVTGFDEILNVELIEHDSESRLDELIHFNFKKFLTKNVSESADKKVLFDALDSYSWREIDECSHIIADDLSKLGIHKGSHVGILGANSANWVLTFFAIQKLGAIAVLLNFNLNASELSMFLKISDTDYLCYGETVEKNIAFDGVKTYSFAKEINYKSRLNEYEAIKDKYQHDFEEDDPAVIIFTSGSSGRPKGVLLSYFNLMNASVENTKRMNITENDKSCIIAPLFHIFGLVANLFSSLIVNSAVYFPENIRTDTILALIAKNQCTIFHSVPAMLIALVNNKNFTPDKVASLRRTIISAAAATPAQIEMFQKNMPANHFMSAYGLSEMAPVSLTKSDDIQEHILHTVGLPFGILKIKIRNIETNEDCGTNQQGEILVQGQNLMLGYYKVPIDDQSIDAEGWLHTGDLGMMDDEGYLRLSGRLKELIIRGGENITPIEVENAITLLSDIISEVKVVGVPSEFFGEEVCACITLKDGAEFDEKFVRSELAKHLSKFKIPSYFIVYNKLPVLGSGKIDLKGLKEDAASKVKEILLKSGGR